jgi:peptide/nickel transport system permease protein
MRTYVIRRLLFFIPVLLAASIVTFLALRLVPGDPALTFLGQQARPEEIERWHLDHGTNRPLVVQYVDWLGGMLRGDPGQTLAGGQSIQSEIKARFPVTALILVFSFTFTMVLGVLFGIIAAVAQDSPADYFVRVLSVFGQSIPSFFLLTLLILVPAILWRYSPPFGWVPFWEDPWRALRQVIPPTFVLAIGSAATLMRLTRSSLLEVLRADYVRTARAKGLKERFVLLRHALKNAMIPVLTIAGTLIATLLGGSVILENITSLPGLGQYTFSATVNRDYNVVMAMVMYAAIVVVTSHLVIDVLYAYLDPRIRYR